VPKAFLLCLTRKVDGGIPAPRRTKQYAMSFVLPPERQMERWDFDWLTKRRRDECCNVARPQLCFGEVRPLFHGITEFAKIHVCVMSEPRGEASKRGGTSLILHRIID
jgi:hypothetical protein